MSRNKHTETFNPEWEWELLFIFLRRWHKEQWVGQEKIFTTCGASFFSIINVWVIINNTLKFIIKKYILFLDFWIPTNNSNCFQLLTTSGLVAEVFLESKFSPAFTYPFFPLLQGLREGIGLVSLVHREQCLTHCVAQ